MFTNMKLSTKLAGGFGLILVALFVVSGISFLKIGAIRKVTNDLAKTHMPLIEAVTQLDSAAAGQELYVTKFALYGDEEYLSRFYQLGKRVNEGLEKAKSLVQVDEELVAAGWLKTIENIAEVHGTFITACATLIEAVKIDNNKAYWGPLAEVAGEQTQVLMDQIKRLLEVNDLESNKVADLAYSTANSTRVTTGAVGLISVIIGTLLAFCITRSITRPINRVIKGLNAGADQVAA
ncbi:MAG: CHASE3 domain-containing protein, partial [Proteobacteria bacterium]|nr:CHASE3 domain-containing protein [Pseudomonadota bacterium]